MKAYIIFRDYKNFPEGMAFLRQAADEIDVRETEDRPDKEELKRLVGEYDILVIGMKESMDEEVFEHATRLKFLCTSSIGTDHINKKFFESDKIKVINVSHANVISVAEFVLAFVMSDIKYFGVGHRSFVAGTDRAGMPSLPREMSSMTIGVVGAGKIAYKFFELIKPFDPKLLCWTFHPEKHEDLGVDFVSLEQLFQESDYVVVLVPLSEDTDKLVSAELLSMAKHDTKLVNVSRMGVVDNEAFRDAVLSGKFHGSLLDALNSEIDANIAKAIIPHIKFSPHVAGVSEEAQVRIFTEIMEKLAKAIG